MTGASHNEAATGATAERGLNFQGAAASRPPKWAIEDSAPPWLRQEMSSRPEFLPRIRV